MPESVKYFAVNKHYARPDNALFVAETGNAIPYARYLFDTLGRGGIGFSPFGMDFTGYANYPLGAPKLDAATVEASGLASITRKPPAWAAPGGRCSRGVFL